MTMATNFRACTCPGEDHPGPDVTVGRGSPEIDILEAEKNKLGPGGKVSQSAQFAPFSHDFFYNNSTEQTFWIRNDTITQPNPYQYVDRLILLVNMLMAV